MKPELHTPKQLKSQNNCLRRQKAYAWAMYYQEIKDQYDLSYDNYYIYTSITDINEEAEAGLLPTHLVNEIAEMAEKLKKNIDCPICMEIIKKDQLVITCCGHKYCKTCYENPLLTKCVLCRKKLTTHTNPYNKNE